MPPRNSAKAMRILVTGAGGFVGRALLDRLAAAGHSGVATGRVPPSGIHPAWLAASRDDVLAGSVAEEPFEAVIHLEVKHHVPRPRPADEEMFQRVNVEGARRWLDWATRRGVPRFVQMSSIKAARRSDQTERVASAAELRPQAFDSIYGWSKALAEHAVNEWASAAPGRIAVILRPAPIYGPGNQANLAAFARQVIAGRPCLVGRGDVRKSVVSKHNVTAATEFVLATAPPGCGVFNVSDKEIPTMEELAATIAELSGAPRPRRIPRALAVAVAPFGDLWTGLTGREFPLSSQRMRVMLETSVYPCDRLVAAGFRHPQTLRDGLTEMIDWLAPRQVSSPA